MVRGGDFLAYTNKVGIDAGGTLIKIAYIDQTELKYALFPTRQIAKAAEWLQQRFPNAEICVTGGKSLLLQTFFTQDLPMVVEFDATCSGVQYLLSKQNSVSGPFILANAGTGTSIHFIDGANHFRVGGTGIGGGTLMGLSYLLTGISDYDEIIRLSCQGDRERIDLKVSHIYEGATPPISGDLTASNFGNVLNHPSDFLKEDILASVIGLVGETITTVSVHAAGQHGVPVIVYIGSSFVRNELLQGVVQRYTVLRGSHPLVLTNGEYSGAIGALRSIGGL